MSDLPPSSSSHHHRKGAAAVVATLVVTVSDTRTPETDTGGRRVAELLSGAGHPVVDREIVKDDPAAIRAALEAALARAEVAAAVLYLAAPEAGYVTGTTLHVNGGMAMI